MRTMMWWLLSTLFSLLVASSALAVEGAACSSYTSADRGDFADVCIFLCDGNHAANEACGEINLGTETDGRGFPHHMTIAIQTEGGCAATPEITPRGLAITGGTAHDLVSVALTTAGTSSQSFETDHKIVDATVADAGSCTNLEVHLVLWYER